MNKIKLLALFVVLLSFIPFSLVKADQVNLDIDVNGTSNINITIDADDTLAREMIAETQKDTYGTTNSSSPKDFILNEIAETGGNPISDTEGLDTVGEICNDPGLQQYLDDVSSLPPLGFVSYIKALGYDDEAHINFIWNLCQQEYIKEHEGQWSTDVVGGGIIFNDVNNIVEEAVNWLISKRNHLGNGDAEEPFTSDIAKELGMTLDRYFASDVDIKILLDRIKILEIRLRALEKAMEIIAEDEYCESKIEVMKEYDLTYVKCGEATSYYWNVDPEEWRGYDVIGITPIAAKMESFEDLNLPDFAITKLNIPELKAGKDSVITVVVKNEGDATGSAKLSLDIPENWISAPEKIDVILQPGEETTVQFIVSVPEEAEYENKVTALLTYFLMDEAKEVLEEQDVQIEQESQNGANTMTLNSYIGMIMSPSSLTLMALATIAISLSIFNTRQAKPYGKKSKYWRKYK